MQQAAEQPNWGAPELPAHLQTAQADVMKAMAARFGPKAKRAEMHLAHAREAFQVESHSTRSAAKVTQVLPTASVSALWGWSSGETPHK